VFVHAYGLTAQLLDGDPIELLEELIDCRFKLLQDGSGISKLCTGRKILEIACEIAGDRRELRERAAAFVSGSLIGPTEAS